MREHLFRNSFDIPKVFKIIIQSQHQAGMLLQIIFDQRIQELIDELIAFRVRIPGVQQAQKPQLVKEEKLLSGRNGGFQCQLCLCVRLDDAVDPEVRPAAAAGKLQIRIFIGKGTQQGSQDKGLT